MTDKGNRRRAVVTGQGLVTPLGRTPDDIWTRWAHAEVAAAPVTKLDLSPYGIRYAAEVRDFEPRKEIRNRKLLRLMIAGEPFGLVAVSRAFEDAGLTPDDYEPERAGVSVGCHKEGFRDSNLYDALDAATTEDGQIDRERLIDDGVRRIPPQTLVEGLANAALYYFAHEFVLQGANINFLSSGTGGALAIGEAMRAVRRDEADLMLTGSYDTWLDWRCIGHQTYAGVLSTRDLPAGEVHRPFDRDRDGGVPGEGAGMMILEDRQRAVRRGATILGEVAGYAVGRGLGGQSEDELVDGYARVILRAIEDAGLSPKDVDLVHLQGEGNISSDRLEVLAVRKALRGHCDEVPATTMTSALGLLGNAAGPVELLMTLQMLRRGIVLPIVGLKNPDPDLPLNYVREPLTGQSMNCGLILQRSLPAHFTAVVVTTGHDA
jgi:3-oxoacyl-[acyl-carrier-protein] synthase II